MPPDVTRPSKPEERELAKKSAELAGLQVELAQCELDLATLRAELRDFERRYLHIAGARYAELDEIEAQITEALAQLSPQDIVIQEKAVHARAQASESAQASKIDANQAPLKDFTPSENLKKLYRGVAKRVHPDFATDEPDRVRRQRFMAEANRAYEDGDEARLTAILVKWESSPEAVKGDGTGAELVRTIRKIAQIRERLLGIEAAIEELKRSDLYQLKMRADMAVAEGRDLLEEIKSSLDEQIAAARNRLLDISSRKGRTVHFPSSYSMGKLFATYTDSISKCTRPLGEAQGEVRVPADWKLHLEITEGYPADLSPLADLSPNALDLVYIGHSKIADPQLMPLSKLTGLREIMLCDCAAVTDCGLAHLRDLCSLESLFIERVPITDAGLIQLPALCSLRNLHLTNTLVTDRGMVHLRPMHWLKGLSLWYSNRIGDTALEVLGEFTWLTGLSLVGTWISDEGIRNLRGMCSLQSLNLSETQISDEGLKHLMGMNSLRILVLSGNRISDKAIAYLARLNSLESLTLYETGVTVDGMNRLKEALPACKVM